MPALIRGIVFTEVLADHRRIKYCLGPNLSPSNFFGSQLFVHTYFIWKSISSVHLWKWACGRECANTCAHDVWAKTALNHFMGCILDTKRVKSVLLLTNSITMYRWSMSLEKTTGSPRLLHTPLSLNHRHKHNNNSEVKSEIDLYSVLFQLSDSKSH